MKVAHLVCTFPPYRGGMGNSTRNIAISLAEQGHEISIFTPLYKNEGIIDSLNDPKEKYHVSWLRPLVKIGNAALLPQILWKLNGFDQVHLHYPFYGTAEIVLLRKILLLGKMKLIIHYHMDSDAKGIKGLIFNFYRFLFLPLIVRCADIITCASLDYIKHSNLSGYYKNHSAKFRQILFGVNSEQFIAYHDDKNKQRNNKIILFVGGLDKAHYFKGLENLIKALAQLRERKQFKNTTLNIVGKGNLKNFYINLSKNLKIEKFVNFFEQVDNIKIIDFYNYCDIVVLPSINKSEAFGLVLLEAMSCAKPVIASNLPGVRSVFKNGKEGLLIKPDDVNDLVSKLSIILADKQLRKSMGEAGRKLVETKYTWEKVGKRLDLIYNYVKFTPKKKFYAHRKNVYL